MKRILKNNSTGVVKVVKQGFSWTTFFFGFFVPLIRGDLKYFFVMIAASLVTFGFSSWVFAFLYNKHYTEDLLNNGFTFQDNPITDFVAQ